MSYFTPADAEYIKRCIAEIRTLSYERGKLFGEGRYHEAAEVGHEVEPLLDRLLAFIDGCTATTRGETKW